MRLLFLLLFLQSGAFALNLTHQGIEAALTAACDEVLSDGLHSSSLNNWNSMRFKSQNFSEILLSITHQALSNSAQGDFTKTNNFEVSVVDSPGYRQGLELCRKRNREAAVFLDNVVRSASFKGNLYGAVALVLIFRGVGGLSARLTGLLGSASIWLEKFSSGMNYVTISRLMRADGQVPEKIQNFSVTDEDLKKRKLIDETKVQHLRDDLLAVRTKILACEKCADEKIFEIYQSTLLEALGVMTLAK